MGKIIKYSDFSISESNIEEEYSIDQIGMAVDLMESDFRYLFFVPEFNDHAIFIYCDIKGDSAEISTEISSDLEYYTLDYDRNDLSKMFRSSLKEVGEEASTSGPKFFLREILESAEEILNDDGAKKYVEDLDISEADVSLRERSSDENGISIIAEFDTSSSIKVDGVDVSKFREDLIKNLISGISKRPNFER